MKKATLLAILVFLFTISSASQIWQYSTQGPVSIKPLIFQNSVVIASDDGNLYALNPTTGQKQWTVFVGKTPNEIIPFGGGVVASTTSGHVVEVGTNGKINWNLDLTTSYNATYVYGASANTNEVFVTADSGVYVIDNTGNVKAQIATFPANTSTPTAPVAGTNFAVYGYGNTLYRVSDTGTQEWKTTLQQGTFWLSRPVISGNTIFIGALDNKVHAYILNGGAELWESATRDWVIGTPLVVNDVVYVGSNDGSVYAMDGRSGQVNWAAQTQLAVESQPDVGVIGGVNAIFVGGTDKSIYAISNDTGEIVWKGPSGGAVGSPLYYKNTIIVGAEDGKVYAYSTERACSIANPQEADIVGLKELVVNGNYVSAAGQGQVSISVNGGNWEPANTTDTNWVYYMDPTVELNAGLNTISCKVTDASGDDPGPGYTEVDINHDPTIALSNFVITISPNVIEGKNFTIFVNDGDDGSPVNRVNLTFNGKPYFVDQNLTIPAPSAGPYQVKVSKIGFNDASATVNVNASGVNPLFLIFGILLIVIIIWQMWTRFLSQKFKKKK